MKSLFQFLAFAAAALPSFALTNYQTGIECNMGGTQGTAWQEETLSSFPTYADRRIIYILDTTTIAFVHNARNKAWLSSGGGYDSPSVIGINGVDTIANSGDEGLPLYRIDREMNWGGRWGDSAAAGTRTFKNFGGGTTSVPTFNWPSAFAISGVIPYGTTGYVIPGTITFATQTYSWGASVVGSVGARAGQVVGDWPNYAWMGIADSLTDEWHTISVADDDHLFCINDVELKSSDSKIYLFVVNPKTPCLVPSVTGNAQFYTTPPKAYFAPKISDQTTVFSAGTGTFSLMIQDINGGNVSYSINGGATVAPGSSSTTLAASDFSTGTNTLQYWFNPSFKKTRTIIKDPTYPSTGETHGYLAWGNSTNYSAFVTRLGTAPYAAIYAEALDQNFFNGQTNFDSVNGTGVRYNGYPGRYPPLMNAVLAKTTSWTAVASGKSLSYAQYAKLMIMQGGMSVDPVGTEILCQNTTIPCRELYYRGYYDTRLQMEKAFAYDILIADYKSTQVTGGITAVEDWFIRNEVLAPQAYMGALVAQGYRNQEEVNPGMWGTSWQIAGLITAMAMPSYTSAVFGTSGFDGNTTTYNYTPNASTPLTWKKTFLDNNSTLVGYPNLTFRFGMEEYEFDSSGNCLDRVAYLGWPLIGQTYGILMNATQLNTSQNYPNTQKAIIKMANGTIHGTDDAHDGTGPVTNYGFYNSKFVFSDYYAEPMITLLQAGDTTSVENFKRYYEYGWIWYQGQLPLPQTWLSGPVTLSGSAKIK